MFFVRRKKDSETVHWADLEMQTAGMPPPILLFLCAVAFSVVVVVGETVFLAPVLDGIGIADPVWQYLLAAGIVLVCSGLFEITKKQWQQVSGSDSTQNKDSEQLSISSWSTMIFLGFVNLLALLLVSILGWWRAEEMIFAAKAQAGAWQGFLGENATLTRVVVVLLTVSLPVFVAMAFDWGISGLRFANEWRKTFRAYKRLTADLPRARKQLESEEEKAESEQQALDEQRDQWKQSYLQNHELGQKVGAQQLPLWQTMIKVLAAILLLIVACLLIDPFLSSYVGGSENDDCEKFNSGDDHFFSCSIFYWLP